MTKGVFAVKPHSGYDDSSERYHFPRQYLKKVEQTVGDLIVYYEPRRGGGDMSYTGVGQVAAVEIDPSREGLFYARITDSLMFESKVSFRGPGGLFERRLQSEGQTGLSGDFRNAVRLLDDDEFEAIWVAGFAAIDLSAPGARPASGMEDESEPFVRPLVEQLLTRPFREAAFSRQVKRAYGATCAFTGLDMRNGGGRTEVDAAHIKPVGDGHGGSDSVRNGLALSKTVHWMFDRGLLSVDSDYRILTAGSLVPEPIKRLINPSGRILLPRAEQERPNPAFLDYHRNCIFKAAQT